MKTIIKTLRSAAALLPKAATALIAVTILAASMYVTAASPEETTVILKCESGISSQYTVEAGQTISLTVGSLNEAHSGDTSIATVAGTGSKLDNLQITGKSAGLATIAYGTEIGALTVVRYQVTDSKNISSYIIRDGGTIRLNNSGDSGPVPVTVTSGTDNIVWKSLNEMVASVGANTGIVSANKKGVAIIIGEYTDKWGVNRDIHILVGVGVSLDGTDNGGGGSGSDPNDPNDPDKPDIPDKPDNPITGTGPESCVNGRTLDDAQTGDGAWIEVARNGDYSLIIRKDFIKCYSNQDQSDYWNWYAPKVSGQDYRNPDNFLRKEINKWFNSAISGSPDGRQALAKDARLRDYTVQNDAYNVTGTAGQYPNSMTDGFSKPSKYQAGQGNDIAFALSWSEAANFCSVSSRYRVDDNERVAGSAAAAANFEKLNNLRAIYLRTTGDVPDTMAMLFKGSGVTYGEVFQNSQAYIHPALWVHQDIFK